jgi:hypothetical protein
VAVGEGGEVGFAVCPVILRYEACAAKQCARSLEG